MEVSAAELARGVAVLTGAPGALVRLNPAPGEKGLRPIDPRTLILKDPAGKAFAAGTGMDLVATAAELRAAGAPFVEGTAAFRIRADLGAGTFEMRGDVAPGRYVVHVLDAGSDLVLTLRTLASDYLHGQRLVVETAFDGGRPGAAFFAPTPPPAARAPPAGGGRGRRGCCPPGSGW